MSRKSFFLSMMLMVAAGVAGCNGPDRSEPIDLPGEQPYTPDDVQPDTPPEAPPEMEPVPENEMEPVPDAEPPVH